MEAGWVVSELKWWSSKWSGESNGTPLQYSCLENPMDGGAWRLQSMWSQRHGHELLTLLSLPYLPRDKPFRWGAFKRHQRQLLAMTHSQPLRSTMVPYPQVGFITGFLDAGSCQKSLPLHYRMQFCRGYLCKGQSSVTKLHGEGSWAYYASNFSSIKWK